MLTATIIQYLGSIVFGLGKFLYVLHSGLHNAKEKNSDLLLYQSIMISREDQFDSPEIRECIQQGFSRR